MEKTGVLSAERLSGLNQVVATAERLIRARGLQDGATGVFEDADFSIVAGQDRHGHHGLTITWQSREVFRAWWRDSGWPARVELDEPGPWKAALLATPTHHA